MPLGAARTATRRSAASAEGIRGAGGQRGLFSVCSRYVLGERSVVCSFLRRAGVGYRPHYWCVFVFVLLPSLFCCRVDCGCDLVAPWADGSCSLLLRLVRCCVVVVVASRKWGGFKWCGGAIAVAALAPIPDTWTINNEPETTHNTRHTTNHKPQTTNHTRHHIRQR